MLCWIIFKIYVHVATRVYLTAYMYTGRYLKETGQLRDYQKKIPHTFVRASS